MKGTGSSLLLFQAELYFAGVEGPPVGFYSCRNELESLNSILSLIHTSLDNSTPNRREALHVLQDATIDMIRAFGDRNNVETRIQKCTPHAEELLQLWGQHHGLRTKLQIACKSPSTCLGL